MPKNKKKTQVQSVPETLKAEGNTLFMAEQYAAAIAKYTEAIEKSTEGEQAVYFSNRANCHLELRDYQKAI